MDLRAESLVATVIGVTVLRDVVPDPTEVQGKGLRAEDRNADEAMVRHVQASARIVVAVRRVHLVVRVTGAGREGRLIASVRAAEDLPDHLPGHVRPVVLLPEEVLRGGVDQAPGVQSIAARRAAGSRSGSVGVRIEHRFRVSPVVGLRGDQAAPDCVRQ